MNKRLLIIFGMLIPLSGFWFGMTSFLGHANTPTLQWQFLSTPPEPIQTIRWADCHSVIVEALSKKFYQLNDGTHWGEVWSLPTLPVPANQTWEHAIPSPLDDIAQQIEFYSLQAESVCYSVFALTEDGQMALWQQEVKGMDILFLFLWPSLGALLGLVIGLPLVVAALLINHDHEEPPPLARAG